MPYSPHVIPVVLFPDMTEPDAAIENLAKHKGMYVASGAANLLIELEKLVPSRKVSNVSRSVCGLSETKSFGLSGSRIGQSRDPPIRRLSSRQEAVEPRQTTMAPNPCVHWRHSRLRPIHRRAEPPRPSYAPRAGPNGDRNPKTVRRYIHHHCPEYPNTKQR